MRIDFIGLGNMGSGMAVCLLKSGHDLTVYNRTPAKIQPLVEQVAHPAEQLAEACRGEAVITMLADDQAVEAVAFGSKGVMDSLGKGTIHISMSTISVALGERLATAHAAAGQRLVVATVLGRPEAAAAAKLIIISAGARDDVAACQPIFEALAQKIFYFGEKPSMANLIKLSTNFLIFAVAEMLGEAMALVGKGGVDERQYFELLTTTLFEAPVFKTYGELLLEKKFKPAGFAAPLGLKDIRLALAAAETLRVSMPVASLLRDRFLTLLAQGGEDLDWSAISQIPAQEAGQKVSLGMEC
jgi:3-hydroxyisobutyrate dehydrogenase-like beta-hydroxyacid dehydrogenase